MKKLGMIDIEPKWVNLIDFLLNTKNKEMAKKELMKIAEIADIVRQAQKKKELLTFDFREGEKHG